MRNKLSGVTIDADGVVTEIIMTGVGLAGGLCCKTVERASFANLKGLRKLSMNQNALIGEIPWEMLHGLVQQQSLRKLDLGGNKFTVTTIPAIVSTMENLVELSLSSLGYTGPIPDFSKHVNLEVLTLDTNNLEGNIPDFSQNLALQKLYLNSNKLSGAGEWKKDTSKYPTGCIVMV